MFPDLTLKEKAKFHSEGQGVPDNGDNEFAHGINPDFIKGHEEQLQFDVFPQGPSITGATFVGLSADFTKVTLNFTQGGADEAIIKAEFEHSMEW
jgi:hypothetical protein